MKGLKLDAKSTLVGAGGGVLLGGLAGYLVCRRVLQSGFDQRLDAEVASVKAHYNDRIKSAFEAASATGDGAGSASSDDVAGEGGDGDDGTPAMGSLRNVDPRPILTPADVLDDSDPRLEGLPTEKDLEDAETAGMSVEAWLERKTRGVVDAELEQANTFDVAKKESAKKPYRISLAEFGDAPPSIQQQTLTYYASDQVLTDDKDEPIRDVVKIVGALTPLSFGGQSENPHICYVRNEELEVDFEIVLDAGSYADAVLGYGKPNQET